MTKSEIEARELELRMAAAEDGADLTEIDKELRSLLAERAELAKQEEERAKVVEDVIETIVPESEIRTFEEVKVEKRMEYAVDSKEYRSLWLQNLQGRQTEEVRAFATSDSHTAIPTEVADKFFIKMKKLAPMLDEITLMRVAGNIKFTAQDTVNAAAAHTENNAVSPAGDTIVTVTLGGKEFMKVLRISKAVATMAVDAFESWLVEYLGADIARKIEDYILNDTTNGIAAVTYTTSTNQILSTTGYTYKNICSLIALLPAGYDAEAKFVINKKTLYNEIATITTTTGKPIFVESPELGCKGYIMGYPVVVSDYVTTANNAVYLGAWKNVVGNLSQDVTVERSEQSGFLNGSIDFRGYALFDSAVANKEAIVRLVSTTA